MTAIKKMPEVAKVKLNGEAPKTPVIDNKILVVRPDNTEKKDVEPPKTPEVKPEVPEAKKEQLLLTEVKEEKPSISLEDKIYKIQILGELIDQREKLNDSLKKLESFKTVSNHFLDKIILKDSNGNEFSTGNSDILQKCIKIVKDTILEKMQAVEAQITF